MKLENPILFHLLWVLLLQAILLFAYWRWRKRTLRQLGSPALEEKLLLGFSLHRFWLKNALFALTIALVVFALVNPYREVRAAPKKQLSSDVIFALDVSQSMLVEDVQPSRLESAKNLIKKLVQSLDNERLGLIFFAGEAFPEAPLSTEHNTLLMFASSASPAFVTNQGTNIDEALQLAGRLFDPGSDAGHTVVLITDGENFGPAAATRAKTIHDEGVVVHTVAIGVPVGGKIRLAGNNFKRGADGKPIQSRPDFAALREIAREGGGVALSLDAGENAVANAIKDEVARQRKAEIETRAGTDNVSYFQWLLLPAILFLILEQMLWWRKRVKTDKQP